MFILPGSKEKNDMDNTKEFPEDLELKLRELWDEN